MEGIIAFREERASLQMHLHHHQQELVEEEEEEEEEGSYYATAVREEEDEYFEATGRSQHQHQHQQQDRACDSSSGVEDTCHQSEEQLKEFSDYFLRRTKEIIDKKATEVRRRRI